jgi:siroheme synthase-like protein
MDDVPHCNFVSGSVVRRGPLVISISTSGAAPTLSVRLRQRMEEEFGPEYEAFLHVMQALRDPMAAHYPGFDERRRLWYEVADSEVLELLRLGLSREAHARIASIVGEEVVAEAQQTLRESDHALQRALAS